MKKETIIECENVYENENEEVRTTIFNNIIANIINVQIKELSK